MATFYDEWQPMWMNRFLRWLLLGIGALELAIGLWIVFTTDDPESAWFLLVFVFVALLVWMGLRTRVHSDHLEVFFVPLRRRRIRWADIESAEAVTVRPMADFGGWGIRYGGNERGWIYNVAGKHAIRIATRDGKILHVGTQDPARLLAAIDMVRGQDPSQSEA